MKPSFLVMTQDISKAQHWAGHGLLALFPKAVEYILNRP